MNKRKAYLFALLGWNLRDECKDYISFKKKVSELIEDIYEKEC